MSDEESIAFFTNITGDGILVTYEENTNPFRLVPDEELISARRENNKRNLEAQVVNRHMTLVQRNDNISPRVPPCDTRATRLSRSALSQKPADSPRAPKKRERTTTMKELMQEKREIYKLQLFIDQKKKEMKDLVRTQKREESKLLIEEQSINEMSDKYKLYSVQIEAAVAKRKRFAEDAARQAQKLSRKLHDTRSEYETLQSDIVKNEGVLEKYQLYYDFLKLFVEPGTNVMDKFKHINDLLDELHRFENENLFIIEHYEHLKSLLTVHTSDDTEEYAKIKVSIQRAQQEIDSIISVPEFVVNATKQKEIAAETENELSHLTVLVKKTYESCFGPAVDMSPLIMLEKIENKLDAMYRLEEYVSEEFVNLKKAAQLKERREIRRQEKQEKAELEQQRKHEQAIERAIKPIPRKYGRPIYKRVTLNKVKHHDDEKIKMRQLEAQREFELLYEDENHDII